MSSQGAPFLGLTLIPSCHAKHIPMEWLVDTGSPWTVVSPKDAQLLNIPVSKLPKATETPNIFLCGSKFERHMLGDVTLGVIDADGKGTKISFPKITVLGSTHNSDIAMHMPSILGCDFLTFHKFTLHFNPSNNEGYIENSE